MKAHDLNALTLELARRHDITFAAARSLLSRRGAAARRANRRRTDATARRIEHARHIADRISP